MRTDAEKLFLHEYKEEGGRNVRRVLKVAV